LSRHGTSAVAIGIGWRSPVMSQTQQKACGEGRSFDTSSSATSLPTT
jgi:hypothetical protein